MMAERPILEARALEASARAFWPLGNTRLERRLGRILAPTLLLWGADDRVVPRAYAGKLESRISGPVTVEIIPGAGHLPPIEQPEATTQALVRHLGRI